MVGLKNTSTNGRDAYSSYGSIAKSGSKTINADGSITIEYDKVYNSTDTYENPTGEPYKMTYYSYETENGQKGSTTRNIYGIYDMSGGAYEYTASYLNQIEIPSKDLTTAQSMVKKFNENIADWEKTGYAGTWGVTERKLNYQANKEKYGDAIWETASDTAGDTSNQNWNADHSDFPYLTDPFFRRGGRYGSGATAGVFAIDNAYGGADGYCSFRPVVLPSL